MVREEVSFWPQPGECRPRSLLVSIIVRIGGFQTISTTSALILQCLHRAWEVDGADAKLWLLGAETDTEGSPPKLTTYLSGMGKEDSGCSGVTEIKVTCHKVVAGRDQYPSDPLLKQMSSSLRGRNYNLLVTVFPVCTTAPGTKLVLKKYLMK